jgi:Icc-related predicted phosphoesterase
MKIWHISDTHMNQGQLEVPQDVDIVIHSGDASNWKDPYKNESEMRAFIDWFASLPIPNKIFVAGNHDTSIEKGLIKADFIESRKINYLYCEERVIAGLRFWGAPYTPRYGDWSFMKDRGTINRLWETIPAGVDVIVTHGPPYGVLDATIDRSHQYNLCGDSALMKAVTRVAPRLVCFGHIHSYKEIRNAGTRTIHGMETIFSNGSCVDDGKWGAVTSNGNIISL